MAAAFARAAAHGARPARAVVFALWNGEEKARSAPSTLPTRPVPARRVVANVNLDMIGRDEDIPDPDDPRFRGFAQDRRGQNTQRGASARLHYSPDLAPLVRDRERHDRPDDQAGLRPRLAEPGAPIGQLAVPAARRSGRFPDDRTPPGLPHARPTIPPGLILPSSNGSRSLRARSPGWPPTATRPRFKAMTDHG